MACPNGAARDQKAFRYRAPAPGARIPASGTEIIAGRIYLLIDNLPNSIGQICALAMTETARDPRASRYAEVRHIDPGSMRAVMETDMPKWGPVVRAVGLKPE